MGAVANVVQAVVKPIAGLFGADSGGGGSPAPAPASQANQTADAIAGSRQPGQRQAFGGRYASERRQAAQGGAGSAGAATLLTGPGGVPEEELSLGSKTLLGG